MGARMRAPRRERSRGGSGCRAEQIAARAADAFEYALCAVHADRSAEGVNDERTGTNTSQTTATHKESVGY